MTREPSQPPHNHQGRFSLFSSAKCIVYPPSPSLILTDLWGVWNNIFMNAKPWDILDKNKRSPEEVYKERMDICNNCEHLINMTKQCKKCGCFMEIKTKINNAFCPIGKWFSYTPSE